MGVEPIKCEPQSNEIHFMLEHIVGCPRALKYAYNSVLICIRSIHESWICKRYYADEFIQINCTHISKRQDPGIMILYTFA